MIVSKINLDIELIKSGQLVFLYSIEKESSKCLINFFIAPVVLLDL